MTGSPSVSVAYSTVQLGAALAVLVRYPVLGDLAGRSKLSDGIIVLDSGAYIRGARHWTEYMAELLFHIYVSTGQRYRVGLRRAQIHGLGGVGK